MYREREREIDVDMQMCSRALVGHLSQLMRITTILLPYKYA